MRTKCASPPRTHLEATTCEEMSAHTDLGRTEVEGFARTHCISVPVRAVRENVNFYGFDGIS